MVERTALLLRALGDPTRLRLALLLARNGEMCVCRLWEAVGGPRYGVSRHLGVLRSAGIVAARREGTWMHYRLDIGEGEPCRAMLEMLAGSPGKGVETCGDGERLREAVRGGYGRIAESGGSCCGSSPCCGGRPADDTAESLGYDRSDLEALPEGANMGLSCGNPTALASLLPGEVVLDLGSGGGFDAFLAAMRVGPSGRVIGVDMTAAMISKARGNLAEFRESTGLENVEFRLGEIENLPVADSSVDVVLSNCVINLSPDKPRVWREIARVLKPGGRLAVSDPALLRPLPDALRTSLTAYVGCIAGAVLVEETEQWIADAGLEIRESRRDAASIGDMVSGSEPLHLEILRAIPEGLSPADFVTNLDITAVKPLRDRTEARG